MNQKLSFAVLIVLSIGLFAFYVAGDKGGAIFNQAEYAVNGNPTLTKSFTVNGPGNMEVTTSGGSISVEGKSQNTVDVEVFIKRQGRTLSSDDPSVQNIKEGYEFRMEQNGNNIEIYTKRKINTNPWKRISFSFNVTVPNEMSNKLKTSGGSIQLAGVKGEQKLKTSGGSIQLADVTGNTSANTSGGSIQASGQNGDLDLNTSGGSISVNDATGSVVAHTSGGSVRNRVETGSPAKPFRLPPSSNRTCGFPAYGLPTGFASSFRRSLGFVLRGIY